MPANLPLSGWRFADLNGDQKDDLVYVDSFGKVTTWINKRGYALGLTPKWASMGVTHTGSTSPQNVTFGRIWNSGGADYTRVEANSGIKGKAGANVYVTVNENIATGGRMSKGDGARYCGSSTSFHFALGEQKLQY